VVENRLYTGSTDGSLRIWTLKGLRRLKEEEIHPIESTDDAANAARQRNAAEQ